jgi:hypothetical protein
LAKSRNKNPPIERIGSARIDRVDYGRDEQRSGVSGAKVNEHTKVSDLLKGSDEVKLNEQ